MGSWVQQILEANPDLAAMPVVKRARRSLHLRRPDGKILGLFTGAPIHYRDERDKWQPLDTTPLYTMPLYDTGPVLWDCLGLNVVITSDGIVCMDGYRQHTRRIGLFRPSKIQLLGTRKVPLGSRVGDALVADGDWWRVERRITPTGYRETLILKEQPSIPQAKAGDFLVLETLVGGVTLPNGWVEGEYAISEHWSPMPTAWDANNEPLTCRRYWRDGVLYTGIPVGELDHAAYPVTIDPDFVVDAADGYVVGQHANYATARSTSVYSDDTGVAYHCGQVWDDPNFAIRRAFLKFDTSGIGVEETIIQVNLHLTVYDDHSDTEFDVQIVKQDWSAQDPIDAGNREAAYDNCLAGTEDDSIWRNTAGVVVDTKYASGNLDITWPNPTGNTYYSLRSSRDKAGTSPSGYERIGFHSREAVTEAYRPYLAILYEGEGETVSFLGIVLATSTTPDDADVDVERELTATALAASVGPDDVVLEVEREFSAVALSASATSDDAALGIQLQLAATTILAASATPDDIVLALNRALSAASLGTSVAPDTVSLALLRAFQATVLASSVAPDDVDLQIDVLAFQAAVLASSATADDALLLKLIALQASALAASSTPDLAALAVVVVVILGFVEVADALVYGLTVSETLLGELAISELGDQ